MRSVLISICIPAYKQPHFLRRLLESIKEQEFSDYEVIVTDDTPDDSIKSICRDFSDTLPLHYYYNEIPLGSPANWNAAVSKSNGEWIKIMHGDDWFTSPNSLGQFHHAILNGNSKFIFSSYYNQQEATGSREKISFPSLDQYLLKHSPFNLLRRNYIGPPSTTLLHRSLWQPYNPELKWIVDFEGYIRILLENKGVFFYVKEPLVCIGVHPNQVTSDCFLIPEVEIPENTLLANKYGPALFQNFFAYDYFWRLIRNLNIQGVSEFESYLAGDTMPPPLATLVKRANRIPKSLRAVGAVSKSLAFLFWTEQLLRRPASASAQSVSLPRDKH